MSKAKAITGRPLKVFQVGVRAGSLIGETLVAAGTIWEALEGVAKGNVGVLDGDGQKFWVPRDGVEFCWEVGGGDEQAEPEEGLEELQAMVSKAPF